MAVHGDVIAFVCRMSAVVDKYSIPFSRSYYIIELYSWKIDYPALPVDVISQKSGTVELFLAAIICTMTRLQFLSVGFCLYHAGAGRTVCPLYISAKSN